MNGYSILFTVLLSRKLNDEENTNIQRAYNFYVYMEGSGEEGRKMKGKGRKGRGLHVINPIWYALTHALIKVYPKILNSLKQKSYYLS